MFLLRIWFFSKTSIYFIQLPKRLPLRIGFRSANEVFQSFGADLEGGVGTVPFFFSGNLFAKHTLNSILDHKNSIFIVQNIVMI